MGVDWLLMRPKTDYSAERLLTLIEQQALAFIEYGGLYDNLSATLPAQTDLERQQALQRYIKSSHELVSCLDIIQTNWDEFAPAYHVSIISTNSIFPIEWRIHAFRTYLPDQLPHISQQWRSYMEDVWRGRHQSFLLDLFLYLRSHELRELWDILRFLGERATEMNNAFTQKPKFKISHRRLMDFPPPPHFDPPIWEAANTQESSADTEAKSDYQELMQYQQNIELLRRDWKYNVPSNMKPPRYTPQIFDDYLAFASKNQDQLQRFFDWLEKCVRRGYGLFLDA